MSVKDMNKEILITSCLNGNIIARFPYFILSDDNKQTFNNLIACIVRDNIDFGIMIKVH